MDEKNRCHNPVSSSRITDPPHVHVPLVPCTALCDVVSETPRFSTSHSFPCHPGEQMHTPPSPHSPLREQSSLPVGHLPAARTTPAANTSNILPNLRVGYSTAPLSGFVVFSIFSITGCECVYRTRSSTMLFCVTIAAALAAGASPRSNGPRVTPQTMHHQPDAVPHLFTWEMSEGFQSAFRLQILAGDGDAGAGAGAGASSGDDGIVPIVDTGKVMSAESHR